MPCNGVAVANGKIQEDLAGFVGQMHQEPLQQAVIALLEQLKLGKVEDVQLYGRHSGQKVTGISLEIGGRYLLNVQGSRVTVNTKPRSRSQKDRKALDSIRDGVQNLLNGMGGLALQQSVVQQLQEAGIAINGFQQAPNGALVLEIEV